MSGVKLETLTSSEAIERFAGERRLRLPSILEEETCRNWAEALRDRRDWALAMSLGGQQARIGQDRWNATAPEERRDLLRQLHGEAADGRGFLYETIPLETFRAGPLAGIREELEAEDVLSAISELTGERVTGVSAQATRYRPGHYLTRHRDDPEGESRRFAYVLSLTGNWHPDWGGLLQFFETDGTPRDAWPPGFGSLALFDVREIHSVTYVTPWARAPRLSVTGWFSA
jgi:hypothetical protein